MLRQKISFTSDRLAVASLILAFGPNKSQNKELNIDLSIP